MNEKVDALKEAVKLIVGNGKKLSDAENKLLTKLQTAIDEQLIELTFDGENALRVLVAEGINTPGKYKVVLKKYKENSNVRNTPRPGRAGGNPSPSTSGTVEGSDEAQDQSQGQVIQEGNRPGYINGQITRAEQVRQAEEGIDDGPIEVQPIQNQSASDDGIVDFTRRT